MNQFGFYCGRRFLFPLIAALILLGLNSPGVAAPNQPDQPLTIKIITLNLHGGKDETGRDNLAKTRQLIEAERPDLVFLQEIQPAQVRSLQPAGYHTGLGMNLNLFAYHFGNAILTRHQVAYHRHFYLPSRLEQRGMDAMILAIAGQSFMVVNTHLGLGLGERQRQLAEIQRVLGYFQGPVILCGDFNTLPYDPLFAPLRNSFQEIGARLPLPGTFPASDPRERLDQIWYNRNWQPQQAGVLAWDGSDHRPVAAALQLTEPLRAAVVPAEVPDPPEADTPLLPAAGRNHARLELTAAHSATGNQADAALQLPITGNLSLTGRYSESGLGLKLNYRLAAFDLRDFLSLWRNIRGKGEWTVSCGITPFQSGTILSLE